MKLKFIETNNGNYHYMTEAGVKSMPKDNIKRSIDYKASQKEYEALQIRPTYELQTFIKDEIDKILGE